MKVRGRKKPARAVHEEDNLGHSPGNNDIFLVGSLTETVAEIFWQG